MALTKTTLSAQKWRAFFLLFFSVVLISNGYIPLSENGGREIDQEFIVGLAAVIAEVNVIVKPKKRDDGFKAVCVALLFSCKENMSYVRRRTALFFNFRRAPSTTGVLGGKDKTGLFGRIRVHRLLH